MAALKPSISHFAAVRIADVAVKSPKAYLLGKYTYMAPKKYVPIGDGPVDEKTVIGPPDVAHNFAVPEHGLHADEADIPKYRGRARFCSKY
jgi:hypothetical protein